MRGERPVVPGEVILTCGQIQRFRVNHYCGSSSVPKLPWHQCYSFNLLYNPWPLIYLFILGDYAMVVQLQSTLTDCHRGRGVSPGNLQFRSDELQVELELWRSKESGFRVSCSDGVPPRLFWALPPSMTHLLKHHRPTPQPHPLFTSETGEKEQCSFVVVVVVVVVAVLFVLGTKSHIRTHLHNYVLPRWCCVLALGI